MGVSFEVIRVTAKWTYSCAAVSIQSYPCSSALGEVTIILLNLQMAMVPVAWISLSLSVDRRASWRGFSTTSTTTWPEGTCPKSWRSAARCASSASRR